DHRTLQICFEELRRAQEVSPRPNFLVLLGDRYGWRPLPEVISEAEFNQLLDVARVVDSSVSNTPCCESVLRDWYQKDDNYLSSEDLVRPVLNYILQSRQRDLARYGRNSNGEDLTDWTDAQKALWKVINCAYPIDERFENRFSTCWTKYD